MTLTGLALRSLAFYRRTNAASVLGVASAVAVLAGALLVGSSVRASLAGIASSRLGRTSVVVAAENPFTERLADRLMLRLGAAAAPILTLEGIARHESSGRRARDVQVYGIDTRFFVFHGVTAEAPTGLDALLSADLADELGAAPGDDVLVRVARPTDIPLDSLHGRREDVGRSLRLRAQGTLSRDQMGEFSLAPQQGPVRAVFVPLARMQQDLIDATTDVGAGSSRPGTDPTRRINALLLGPTSASPLAADDVRAALSAAIDADDLGLKVEVLGLADGRLADQTSVRVSDQKPVRPTYGPAILVEASSGVMTDAVAEALQAVAARDSLQATPVLTWLANRMAVGERAVPYSLVTAIGSAAAGDATLARLLTAAAHDAGGAQKSGAPIVLNEWVARDLRAAPGDSLELEYYRWTDDGRLATERAPFRVAGIVPMSGLAVDRRLAPDYPGITSSDSVADWDPPFPITLGLVRPIDEDYWRRFRTAPKAFIPLAIGQRLWRTRYGQLTSIRLQPTAPGVDLGAAATHIREAVVRDISPLRAGFTIVDVRNEQITASTGATDFGAYFSYFSFFLMVSALLLAALFFRLSIEHRLSQAGMLRATGFSIAALRRMFLIEGGFISIAGGMAGVALAIGWAGLMMYGLRTWWVGAVGTTLLRLHVDPVALAAGAAGGGGAAALSIAIAVRGLARATPRELLSGARTDLQIQPTGRSRARVAAVACLTLAIALASLSVAGRLPPAAGFFGAGALVLIAGLLAFSQWLRRDAGGLSTHVVKRPSASLIHFGVTNAGWRPGRSVTAAGLVAAAVFLLVSVDAFRKGTDQGSGPASGTGGFALLAESALPIVHDPSTPEGREALGLESGSTDPSLAGVDLLALRLRPGDDASCLNLYQPRRPRVLAVSPRLVDQGRFRFAVSLASSDAERANPWRLLGPADADGIVPAIVDQTSLQYVLHASVGDVLTLDADTARPVRARVVGSLDDSMLQGEILIAEQAFLELFPEVEGYRVLLVDVAEASPERTDEVARLLEERLEPFGLDAENSSRRLEAYHRVENTYLSTFQALGGLGLLLGSFGVLAIIARNVLERRRELALLGAAGYSGRQLQTLVVAENVTVMAAGLVIGVAAALVAIGPVLAARGGGPSALPLAALAGVALVGVVSAVAATRSVRKLPLVASLRSE